MPVDTDVYRVLFAAGDSGLFSFQGEARDQAMELRNTMTRDCSRFAHLMDGASGHVMAAGGSEGPFEFE
jgi:hypothetical protein